MRATADKGASSVQECFICEEDSSEYDHPPPPSAAAFKSAAGSGEKKPKRFSSVLSPAFALDSSALSFPDLCRLVAFYCVSR